MFVFILIISMLLSQQYNKSINAIEKMSDELQALDRLKDEFLTNTSHELRTPLNGIIFTQNGKIEVGASIKHEKAEVWVEDTGCGIPKDKLKVIFKPFYQVDSTETREAGGTGLGLSITKTLVELHGSVI